MKETKSQERAKAALSVRRLAGTVVLLGEALGRRSKREMERLGMRLGGVCVRTAAKIARDRVSSHPEEEARLISVYGAEPGNIPPLAWEMAVKGKETV